MTTLEHGTAEELSVESIRKSVGLYSYWLSQGAQTCDGFNAEHVKTIKVLLARIDDLERAAQVVIDRWDTPLWEDSSPTVHVIGALRRVLGVRSIKPACSTCGGLGVIREMELHREHDAPCPDCTDNQPSKP